MGIFKVKSKTCGCIGEWSTLDPKDHRTYMTHPCKKHELFIGNTIYYKFGDLFETILHPNTIDTIDDSTQIKLIYGKPKIARTPKYLSRIKSVYPAKIIDIIKIDKSKIVNFSV